MGGNISRTIEVGTDTCFLGQNAGKQFIDSAAFNASSLATAGVSNEIQTVEVLGAPSGGSFTLTFGGNASTAIPFNAGAATVSAALQTIVALDDKVQVSGKAGGPWYVHFVGSLAGADQAALTATSSLTGGLSPSIKVREWKKGGVASADPRILVGSGDFPGTIVKKVVHNGRSKVQEYDGTGAIYGIIDGTEEFITAGLQGDRDVAVYRAAGLVVDARKVHNYTLYKTAIDAWASARAITIKHG